MSNSRNSSPFVRVSVTEPTEGVRRYEAAPVSGVVVGTVVSSGPDGRPAPEGQRWLDVGRWLTGPDADQSDPDSSAADLRLATVPPGDAPADGAVVLAAPGEDGALTIAGPFGD